MALRFTAIKSDSSVYIPDSRLDHDRVRRADLNAKAIPRTHQAQGEGGSRAFAFDSMGTNT